MLGLQQGHIKSANADQPGKRKRSHISQARHFCASMLLLSGIFPVSATAQMETPDPAWHVLLGAGTSHIGWGATYEKVETVDIYFRREIPDQKTRGKGWYKNRRTVLMEIPIHILTEPDEPPMLSLTFNSNWTFNLAGKIQPYAFVGGGGLYTNAEIPGTSSSIKGVYQAGGGLRFNHGEMQFSLEARYHHLSNGGIKEPNDSLNSTKVLFGVRLPQRVN